MKTLILVLLLTIAVSAQLSFSYESKDQHEHIQLDWWENAVFYQIYPNSFKDSNGNGRGDLRGIINNLGHLKDLGVTGAWLSPIFKSPMKDGGYDIQDFKQVNPLFGTNEDLEDLFAEAKKLEIKIILDFVPNHTSDQHEWFLKSVNRTEGFEDWYVWRNCSFNIDGSLRPPNNWIAVFHTLAWTYNAERGQCYLHQFTPEQPDLNYRNDDVRAEMMGILRYWLERGADGFRIDAINHMYETAGLPNEAYVNASADRSRYDNLIHSHTMNRPESYEFIYDVREMMAEFEAQAEDKYTRLMMTEAYATVDQTALWYGRNSSRLGSHMPFNFQLIANLDHHSSAHDFKQAIDAWMEAMPDYGIANWVLGNHDRPRVGSRYGEERHESLAIMSMMLPGITVIYYGEEILMTDNYDISFEESDDPQARQTNESVYMLFSRDPVRTPFQWDDSAFAGFTASNTQRTWLPVHANYPEVNLKKQKEAEKSTFKLYQKLIQLRKDLNVLHIGGLETKVISPSLFGFMRTLRGEHTIAVFINLGGAVKTSLKDLMDEEEFQDNMKAKVLIVNNHSTLEIGSMVDVLNIELGTYDAVVLEVSSGVKLTVSLLLIVCTFVKFIF